MSVEDLKRQLAEANAERKRLDAQAKRSWDERIAFMQERDAANAALAEAVTALESMGRRLHIIDHGAVMPPFELCQDMACETRWGLIHQGLPGRRFWAIQDWRSEHPQYAPEGWKYGKQLDGERDFGASLARIEALKVQPEVAPLPDDGPVMFTVDHKVQPEVR